MITEEEKEQRKKNIAYTNATMALEGYTAISADVKTLQERYINGEISAMEMGDIIRKKYLAAKRELPKDDMPRYFIFKAYGDQFKVTSSDIKIKDGKETFTLYAEQYIESKGKFNSMQCDCPNGKVEKIVGFSDDYVAKFQNLVDKKIDMVRATIKRYKQKKKNR